MEDIGKCEGCKFYQGLVEVPNGFGILKDMISCFQFGYLELMIDSESCMKFEIKD